MGSSAEGGCDASCPSCTQQGQVATRASLKCEEGQQSIHGSSDSMFHGWVASTQQFWMQPEARRKSELRSGPVSRVLLNEMTVRPHLDALLLGSVPRRRHQRQAAAEAAFRAATAVAQRLTDAAHRLARLVPPAARGHRASDRYQERAPQDCSADRHMCTQRVSQLSMRHHVLCAV